MHAAEPCQSQRVTVYTTVSNLFIYLSSMLANTPTNALGNRDWEETRRMAECRATSNSHASPARIASHDREHPAPQPPPRQGTMG